MLNKIKKVLDNFYTVKPCESVIYADGFTLSDCLTVSNGLEFLVITYDESCKHITLWNSEGYVENLILGGTQNTMFFELGYKVYNYFHK